jgi:predicted dehydrogenase
MGGALRIGIVGCGDTADQYLPSMRRYSNLELVAVTDCDQERMSRFCEYYSVTACPNLEALLSDPKVKMIVNLTHSGSHYEVNKACLNAGKHLYSEKPLASTFAHCRELVELAAAKQVCLSSAPCTLLGEAAQTLWRALRDKATGTVRLVYAEVDDGPLHMMDPHLWRSKSGAPYAYRSAFQSGAVVEHAGYYLSWFAAFFGPAKTVRSFSACLWPNRQVVPDEPLELTAPDVGIACITFESGVVVRLTCSLIAPYNHSMQIIGDNGILSIDECWNYSAPVYFDRYSKLKFRAERYAIARKYPVIKNMLGHHPRTYPALKKVSWRKRQTRYRMDYGRGVAELARAINEERESRLPPDFCLHVHELLFAIQNSTESAYKVTTSFKPLQPMDEASLREVRALKW